MLIGPLPTPGIAYLTRKFDCDFGVVISASHNLYDDNGIKFFDSEGGKLSDEIEEAIEAELERGAITQSSVDLGRASRVDKSRRHYQDFCAESLPKGMTLEGMKLVVDCANGAGYKVVPRTLDRPRRRNHSDGLFAERPQHQRWLRLDFARPPAADGARRARGRRHRARWRRRSARHGRWTRARRRRRPTHLHHRDRAQARGHAQGSRRRHRHEQSRARGRAAHSRASISGVRRSATATCSACCAKRAVASAARPPATSCCSTRRPRAMRSWPPCRCSRSCARRGRAWRSSRPACRVSRRP